MSEKELETQEVEKKQIESEKNALQGKSADELIEIIRETRTEAKERRLKAKELEERLSAIEKEKEQQITEKKLAEGKKDEVIAELTGKLEETKKKAEEWDKYNTTKRDKLKETLRDNWLESYKFLTLDDLEILASKFNGKTLLATDNGEGKLKQPGKMEALLKDLKLAKERKDLPAQIAINRMIDEERAKK